MRYAYADPPYLGMGKMYATHHPDAYVWDDPDTHRELVDRLCAEYDGWALSLSTPSLATILPMCPPDVRVCAWVKPFASFKPGVNPGYCWEPVILWRPRTGRARTEPTVRDFLAEPIAMRRGLPGAKPVTFCLWVLDLLGVQADDQVTDVFPGTGVMSEAMTIYGSLLPFEDVPCVEPQ